MSARSTWGAGDLNEENQVLRPEVVGSNPTGPTIKPRMLQGQHGSISSARTSQPTHTQKIRASKAQLNALVVAATRWMVVNVEKLTVKGTKRKSNNATLSTIGD